jgi:putative endonuclease
MGQPPVQEVAMTHTTNRSRGPAERTRTLGAYGEAYAARHLVDRGMVLLDRNWRCELGEIDLVLRDGDVLVFCEVKTRRSVAYGTPLEAVTERKAARLRRLAARWLAAHRLRPGEVRLDVVGVLVPHDGPPSVEHARGVG